MKKNKWIALFLCAFTICGHKFYEGRIKLGILYFFTAGLFGIGWLIDLIELLLKPNPYYIESSVSNVDLSLENYDFPLHEVSNYFKLENLEKRFSTSSNINISSTDTVACFKDGQLYRTQPANLENWYDVKYIESDGVIYNLEDTNSIKKISTTKFGYCDDLNGYGITGSLDYVLRMKAGVFYNRNQKELCSACLWKATELMLANESCGWKKEDFDRLINWHYELGMYDEAEKAKIFLFSKERYSQNVFDYTSKKIRNSVLQRATESHHDLIVFDDYGWGCCSKCAKMRGRVYSISGNSKIFPKLPEYTLINGNFHPGCRCSMNLYFGDKIFYKGKRVDAITSSNRPWIDDRDKQEIDAYEKYLSILAKENEEKQNREEYYEILKKLPDIAPKSLSGYVRMKNYNSKNFIELSKIAAENGIIISASKSNLNKPSSSNNYKLEHDDKVENNNDI